MPSTADSIPLVPLTVLPGWMVDPAQHSSWQPPGRSVLPFSYPLPTLQLLPMLLSTVTLIQPAPGLCSVTRAHCCLGDKSLCGQHTKPLASFSILELLSKGIQVTEPAPKYRTLQHWPWAPCEPCSAAG